MKKDLMVNYMSRQLHAENTNLIYVVRNETVRNYGRPAYQMRTLYFCPVSFLFFSSPNLSGRRVECVDVYHTNTHGVALVRI